MKLFHRHKYVEMARTYATPVTPPQRHESDRLFYMSDEGRKLVAVMGLTTVLVRCTDEACGKIKKVEMLGKPTEADVLERMLR